MNGITIPILTQFKFYPVSVTTGNAINYQNIDNTAQRSQDWQGVFVDNWAQPVPYHWYDLSPGIDFQIKIDTGTITYADVNARLLDLDGNLVKLLSKESLLVSGSDTYVRFYLNDLSFNEGCHRIEIRESSTRIYLSEIINIAETHEDCYPLQYSNFENDFGVIFDGWTGKILIPLRMFEPSPEDERETYQNDNGESVTLRSIPKRIYNFESYTVPTWFAEKVKLAFSCSELELNKFTVGAEEAPAIELFSEIDQMEINGRVQLNDFINDYAYEEKIDELSSNLITSWTEDGSWDTFDTTGSSIDDMATFTLSEADTNSISITAGVNYIIEIDNLEGTESTEFNLIIDGNTFSVIMGNNIFIFEASTTGTDNITIEVEGTPGLRSNFSMKKIN